ncbi:helix-turn-helix domain-containing protein [Spirochaeta isovalerica]|uniref:helix-turn-helix domain-containing protein n=1 Tax=Spirochaeta isovalerica TaxID=150 RepID=UPI003CCD3622
MLHSLRNTDLPLLQISEESGYESHSYFIRRFRKIRGCTPGQYRNRESRFPSG